MTQVILIPGIMGSSLSDRFVTAWPQLLWDKPIRSFYNRLKDLENINIQTNGIINKAYGKIKKTLEDNCECVDIFDYDWRKNNLSQVSRLQNLIHRRNADEVIIVAHSMGGIIAKLFLNTCNDETIKNKVTKLITFATPWLGSADAYKALKFGKEIFPVITKKQSKEIVPYFPSIYQLLPREEYISRCANEDLGFYIKDNVPQTWANTYNYYCELLELNNHEKNYILDEYYNILNNSLDVDRIKHYEIIGYNKPTFLSMIENFAQDTHGHIVSGDKTVPLLSAMSETDKKFFVESEHENIVKNEDALKLLVNILNDPDGWERYYNNKVLTYEQVKEIKFDCKIVKVACPVFVSITNGDGKHIYGNIESMDSDEIYKMLENQNDHILTLGDSTYIVLDKDNIDTNVHIEAYDDGPVSVTVEDYVGNNIEKTEVYNTFIINEGIKADLVFNKNLKQSTLHIDEQGKDKKTVIPKIVEKQNLDYKNMKYPNINYDIISEKSYKTIINDISYFFVSGNVDLLIEDIIEGTYDYMETLFSLNNNKYSPISKGERIRLPLIEGENILQIFSKDIVGNTGKVNEIKLFYIKEFVSNVKLRFYQDRYSILCEHQQGAIKKDIFNYLKPSVEFTFNDANGVNINTIEYKDMIRSIIIKIKDIFGQVKESAINVDECLARYILNGTNDTENLLKFLLKIGVSEPLDKIAIKKQSGGIGRKISQENILQYREMAFEKNNIIVEIKKELQYVVLFEKLIEYIEISNNKRYALDFKIIDEYNKSEVDSLDLNVYISIVSDKKDYKEIYKLDTLFNKDLNIYQSFIETDKLLSAVRQGGLLTKEKLKNMNLVIKNVNDKNKVLRIHEIILKY